jgi:hypothetical protein
MPEGERVVSAALAWTLIHFLWEGALIALALAVALGAFKHASARLRYGLACAALLAMPVAFGITLDLLRPHTTEIVTLAPAPVWSDIEPASGALAPPTRPVPKDPLRWLVPLWMLGAGLCVLRSLAGWLAAQRYSETSWFFGVGLIVGLPRLGGPPEGNVDIALPMQSAPWRRAIERHSVGKGSILTNWLMRSMLRS